MLFGDIAYMAMSQLRQAYGENPHARGSAGGQTRPYTDPQNQTTAHLQSFGYPTRLAFGVIMDYSSLAHAYRVHVDHGHCPVVAVHLSQTSLLSTGARQTHLLQPGSRVWLLLDEDSRFGVILGVQPSYAVQALQQLPDQVTQASRTRADPAHRKPLTMLPINGGIIDWSSNRPFDGLGGDAGAITATGLKSTLDDFMVQLAVSEMCGVFGFYNDDLLRIAAYNLQFWTACGERESFNDQDECLDFQGHALFPWEQTSLFDVGDPRRELQPQAFQLDEPWYSVWEQHEEDNHQLPFHRRMSFSGYLGQGQHDIMLAPPPSPPPYWKYEDKQVSIGLYEENVGADGRAFARSAKGFVFSKRAMIPTAKRQKRPEDGRGDNEKNYRFSGKAGKGSGPVHKITGDIETTAVPASLQRAAGVLDLTAYLFNYAGLHPFHYHAEDWYLPEERDVSPFERDQVEIDFSKLAGSMYLDPPEPKKVHIDHRYGEQDYYENESELALLEDGGIVLASGCGVELRAVAGHLVIAAPGDIWLKSGRNVQLWAGWDAILRAQNSVDVSATKHDVRIKAECSFYVLAGNDGPASAGTGGILMESRARSRTYDYSQCGEAAKTSGIVLRAPHSDVVTLSQNLYLRTGPGDEGGDCLGAGDITIDANKGQNQVVVTARAMNHFIDQGVNYHFGIKGNTRKSTSFTEAQSTICSSCFIDNTLFIDGSVLCRGNVLVSEGHIITQGAQSNTQVAPLEGDGLQEVNSAIDAEQQYTEKTLPQTGDEEYQANPVNLFYGSQQAGSDDVVCKAEFSFRKEEEYLTDNEWLLFEDRWQQLARKGSSVSSMPKWKETPVTTKACGPTWPYPGRRHFEGETFYQQDLRIFDLNTGRSINRGQQGQEPSSPYADPRYLEPNKLPLDDNYPVIKKAT